jgi:hypothetical protein
MTTSEHSARRRIAALRQWVEVEDPAARTANGRKAFLDRFERQADPEGRLSPEERAKKAARLRRIYFIELGAKSAAVRRAGSLKSRLPLDGEAEAVANAGGEPVNIVPTVARKRHAGGEPQ